MNRLIPITGGIAALALLAGCAGGGFGFGDGYYGGPAAVSYDGFYDGSYGPFYDGYFAGDGGYYYRMNDHDRFHRDTGNHFRREAAEGFQPVHGHPRAGGHDGGDHHRDDHHRDGH